ncbi:MAG: Rieske (2Fe-2S) protein [Candidatus Porifericomitaceae bacterium WSBS_2022_MAG_OTU9]
MDWIDVAAEPELPPGQAKVVKVEGSPVAVINLDGSYHAVSDLCSHEDWPIVGSGADLAEVLIDGQLVCPHHGAKFCPRTGDALCAPAYEPLLVYPVRVRNGIVQVGQEPEI